MKNKVSFLAIMIFLFVGFNSCNKNNDDIGDEPCSAVWANEVQDEVDTWTNAAIAYGTDPSPANCAAYKAAAQAYIDALEPYGDCASITGAQRSQWEQALTAARESINNIEC